MTEFVANAVFLRNELERKKSLRVGLRRSF